MQRVPVNLAERSYEILVGEDAWQAAGELLADLLPSRKVTTVTDSDVGPIYAASLEERLRSWEFSAETVQVPAGEASKSLETAERLYNEFLDLGMDRDSAVIALGGGMVGDLAGFAAATFMRGIALLQAPTSLLAQIDSSVGGKVAVNLKKGKNLVGAFHQPRLVVADTSTLKTLPHDELVSGMAEVVKHGVILDADLFSFLEEHCDELMKLEADPLEKMVAWNCRLKASVVEKDEQEAELRSILNFGHTLGHALESAASYRGLKHGHAVAMGMVFAARLAIELKLCDENVLERLTRLLKRIGLPAGIGRPIRPEEILETMHHDKKTRGGTLRWVLPRRIGEVDVGCKVDDSIVAELLKIG